VIFTDWRSTVSQQRRKVDRRLLLREKRKKSTGKECERSAGQEIGEIGKGRA